MDSSEGHCLRKGRNGNSRVRNKGQRTVELSICFLVDQTFLVCQTYNDHAHSCNPQAVGIGFPNQLEVS